MSTPAPRTGFLRDEACLAHEPGPGHPERPGRLAAILARVARSGLAGELEARAPRRATRAELERVHDRRLVDTVAAACRAAPRALDGDTAVSEGSWEAALRSAGAALEACQAVVEGRWRNAFCAVRPPGHHAEKDRAMGFCLFNNVAVAAAALRAAHGLERVAIVDFDVHHGNGTQHAFERDPAVFYASLHQWPLYPGTGAARERGLGPGEGATRNCPLPAGAGEREWLAALEGVVLPELEAFRPQFVLVSAGFDAHRADPLAGCRLEAATYATMTRLLAELAARHASGRLVALLEGGYHLEALADSVEAHLGALVEAAR